MRTRRLRSRRTRLPDRGGGLAWRLSRTGWPAGWHGAKTPLPVRRADRYRSVMEAAEVVAFPAQGEVFRDPRGGGRVMRLSWHTEADVAVLSLWQGDHCTGSFRLPLADVPRFVQVLVDGLASATGPRPRRPTAT